MIARWRFTRAEFSRLLAAYQPSPFEVFDDGDPRFTRPAHHALKSRDRLFVALEAGLQGHEQPVTALERVVGRPREAPVAVGEDLER